MDTRSDVLLQIWKDYYDEILEINLDKGTYESLLSDDGKSNKRGFIDIEVLIQANKVVHPDDRQALIDFFDQRKIYECIKSNTFVNKLNFRVAGKDGKYNWVKVKGIMPSIKIGDHTSYFACFRVLDNKSDEDMSYRQMLKSTIIHEKETGRQIRETLMKYAYEMRTPMSGILGIADMAKHEAGEDKKVIERTERIEKEAGKALELIDKMLEECGKGAEDDLVLDEKKLDEIIAWGKSSVMMRKNAAEGNEERPETAAEEKPLQDKRINTETVKEDIIEKSSSKRKGKKTVMPDAADFDFKGKRFLIIEDDELCADVTKEIVEQTGAEAQIVYTGKDGVISYISNPVGYYDAVLLNIVLPDIDGYSVARCIRLSCKEDAEKIVLLATTGVNVKETKELLEKTKINGFATKPVDYGMLFLRLSQIWKSRE